MPCSLGRRRERRGLCLGQLGAMHPSTSWSTLHFQASHVTPSIKALEPLSTSVGGTMSSSLPTAGCSTPSSTASWDRVPVLQLWLDWALLS
jgi:hypothetical protein